MGNPLQTAFHTETEFGIAIAGQRLPGYGMAPPQAVGLVLFVHGSGSSSHSPRNREVARYLNQVGLATLLFDLLTPDEAAVDARTQAFRFNIEFLAQRLLAVTDWMQREEATWFRLPWGYFGASTGAAVALLAAAQQPERVRAVVSRGGRPDLAASALRAVQTPTLLIVGECDEAVLTLNRQALQYLPGKAALEIVPGASHLFEGPGQLEQVAYLASRWFLTYLPPSTGTG